ncbi:MAG: hypothetical protein WA197_10245 [Candidatus Acidiferrales bacterium]
MKRSVGALAFLCFIPFSGAAGQHVQNEGLVRTLGPEWVSMYYITRDLSYDAIELVRNGDTLTDWREKVRIGDSLESSKLSAEETLNKWTAISEKKCPGAMGRKVISKDDSSVLFELHTNPCLSFPEESEIGRIIMGKYSWYVLEYRARVHELAPDTRAQWIKTFSDATFDSVTSSFDSAWMSVDVDEVIPFAADKAMAALKPAMESQECHATAESAGRLECKRPRGHTSAEHSGYGGESVTAVLETQGDKTHVVITTGLGFYGRLGKRNYSTPIYQEMIRNLQKGQP